jgi:hypothetical protein
VLDEICDIDVLELRMRYRTHTGAAASRSLLKVDLFGSTFTNIQVEVEVGSKAFTPSSVAFLRLRCHRALGSPHFTLTLTSPDTHTSSTR